MGIVVSCQFCVRTTRNPHIMAQANNTNKVVLVGDGLTGKTSIYWRFHQNTSELPDLGSTLATATSLTQTPPVASQTQPQTQSSHVSQVPASTHTAQRAEEFLPEIKMRITELEAESGVKIPEYQAECEEDGTVTGPDFSPTMVENSFTNDDTNIDLADNSDDNNEDLENKSIDHDGDKSNEARKETKNQKKKRKKKEKKQKQK